MTYNIIRYEENSKTLFICINHGAVSIEHFFTPEERADEKSRIATIEKLIAELELKAEAYVEPEPFIDKLTEARVYRLDAKKIVDLKSAMLTEKAIAL